MPRRWNLAHIRDYFVSNIVWKLVSRLGNVPLPLGKEIVLWFRQCWGLGRQEGPCCEGRLQQLYSEISSPGGRGLVSMDNQAATRMISDNSVQNCSRRATRLFDASEMESISIESWSGMSLALIWAQMLCCKNFMSLAISACISCSMVQVLDCLPARSKRAPIA